MSPALPLVLMARLPIPGQVKTRLAESIGAGQACAIYRACVEHAVEQIRQVPSPAQAVVAVADPGGLDQARRWLGPDLTLWQQQGDDLSARLQSVFDRAARERCAGAIVLASDTPELSTELLCEAAAALETHQAVIGPATDGGYYLLGLRRCPPAFFSHMPWSTERVLSETEYRLRTLGWSCRSLAPLADLDTAQDLRGWRERWPDPPERLRALSSSGGRS